MAYIQRGLAINQHSRPVLLQIRLRKTAHATCPCRAGPDRECHDLTLAGPRVSGSMLSKPLPSIGLSFSVPFLDLDRC